MSVKSFVESIALKAYSFESIALNSSSESKALKSMTETEPESIALNSSSKPFIEQPIFKSRIRR